MVKRLLIVPALIATMSVCPSKSALSDYGSSSSHSTPTLSRLHHYTPWTALQLIQKNKSKYFGFMQGLAGHNESLRNKQQNSYDQLAKHLPSAALIHKYIVSTQRITSPKDIAPAQVQEEGIYPYDATRDAPAIMDILRADRRFLMVDSLTPESCFEQAIRDLCFWHRHQVYRRNGQTVGFIESRRQGDWSSQIVLLGVKHGERRQGFGRKLIEYELNFLKEQGVDVVNIDVFSRNTPARTLYNILGFENQRYNAQNDLYSLSRWFKNKPKPGDRPRLIKHVYIVITD